MDEPPVVPPPVSPVLPLVDPPPVEPVLVEPVLLEPSSVDPVDPVVSDEEPVVGPVADTVDEEVPPVVAVDVPPVLVGSATKLRPSSHHISPAV